MQTKIGIIGMGKIGKKLLPLFANSFDVAMVYTPSNNSRVFLENFDKSIKHTNKFDDLLNDQDIKTVAILSPNTTHYEYAKKCLESSKDVFVEKPPTTSIAEIIDLKNLANKRNKLLFVDHTFSYMSDVSKINHSSIQKIDLIWKKYGSFNNNIFWNLLYHDIYLILDIIESSEIKNINLLKNEVNHIILEFDVLGIKVRSEIDRNSKDNIKQLTIINENGELKIEPEDNLLSKVVSHFNELISINQAGLYPRNSVDTVKIVEKIIQKSQQSF